jgi:hypothetical protein
MQEIDEADAVGEPPSWLQDRLTRREHKMIGQVSRLGGSARAMSDCGAIEPSPAVIPRAY